MQAMTREPELQIVEGVSGMWHYHLAPTDRVHEAICGAHTMHTSIPLTYWGKSAKHIPESYCEECERKGLLLR